MCNLQISDNRLQSLCKFIQTVNNMFTDTITLVMHGCFSFLSVTKQDKSCPFCLMYLKKNAKESSHHFLNTNMYYFRSYHFVKLVQKRSYIFGKGTDVTNFNHVYENN